MSFTQAKPEQIREFLQQIVLQYGEALCLDQRKFFQLVLQEFPKRPPETVVLHAAVCEGIAADLSRQAGVELSALLLERFARRIFENTGISMELSAWAVEAWAFALGREAEAREHRLQTVPLIDKKPTKALPISRPIGEAKVLVGHRKALTDIAFSPNGRWLASCSIDRTVRIWDGKSGQHKATLFGGHREWIRSLCYRPDGERLATVGDDGGARLWDMKSGRRMHRLIGHRDWARAVAYSHDGRLLVTGGRDAQVCVWEAETSELAVKIGPLAGEVSSVAFDAKGRWLAIACRNRVEMWELGTQQRKGVLDVYGERVVMLSMRDGALLVGDERGLRKLDTTGGTKVLRFTGHDGPVHHLAIDPAYASIVSGGADQTVRVWDIHDAEPRWTFELKRHITGLSVNKAGSIAVGFGDAKGAIWDMGREP